MSHNKRTQIIISIILLDIRVTDYTESNTIYFKEWMLNVENETLKSFPIGFKGLTIQNYTSRLVLLYMVNVMEYGIQYFWQRIDHQNFMFDQSFNV